MKKKIFYISVIIIMMTACNSSEKKDQKNKMDSVHSLSAKDTIKTYVYRGVFNTLYDRLGVATMTLKMVEGSGQGSYLYRVDYGKGVIYEGQEVKPYFDKGVFHSEKSAEFGTIYIMKGLQPVLFYYQPLDNKLSELSHEKKTKTGDVLTGIDPKDSLQTREQVLIKYKGKD